MIKTVRCLESFRDQRQLAGATELLSGDNYFRELVQWTHNPGSAPTSMQAHFTRASTYLKDIVAEATAVDVSQVRLPMAPKL